MAGSAQGQYSASSRYSGCRFHRLLEQNAQCPALVLAVLMIYWRETHKAWIMVILALTIYGSAVHMSSVTLIAIITIYRHEMHRYVRVKGALKMCIDVW